MVTAWQGVQFAIKLVAQLLSLCLRMSLDVTSYRRPEEEDVWMYTCSWWWDEVYRYWNVAAEQNFPADPIYVQSRWVQTCSIFYFCLPFVFHVTGQNSKPDYTEFNPTNCMSKYCTVTSLAQNMSNVTFSTPVVYWHIICTHFYINHLAFFYSPAWTICLLNICFCSSLGY